MDASELPTDVEQLKAMLVATLAEKEKAHRKANQFQQQANELSATVTAQEKKLAAREQMIKELLSALRGKTRERIDPDQLLLFEIGELEKLIEESLAEEKAASLRSKGKKKRGRRITPDNIPGQVIEYELPEDQRRCEIDGQVMSRIRWEESTQLDYVPARIKKIIHRRAVDACSTKHDEAKLVTAPKPPQPIKKALPTAGLLAPYASNYQHHQRFEHCRRLDRCFLTDEFHWQKKFAKPERLPGLSAML